jgi:hypothetical protein
VEFLANLLVIGGANQTARINVLSDSDPGSAISDRLTVQLIQTPDISIARNPNNTLTITWTGGGPLSAATNVLGPYLAVPGASSPFTIQATGTSRFFRADLP